MISCHWLVSFVPLLVSACGEPTDAATIPPAASGTLVSTAPMGSPRAAHTATTLRDGRVLIVGGLDAGGSTAELFDPSSQSFIRSGALAVARHSHTATLLANGRVLIAGGFNGDYLSSTEVFDPATGRFTHGPTMNQPRSGHLAVPLGDGRVLFVGGVSTGWSFLASAEVFDPATNRFTPTGSMSVPRESHVAVRLPNGDVLIAGGHAGRRQNITLYASAELYDPVTGAFRTTGSMNRRRHKHAAAALPDGRILITGGSDERDDRGQYQDAEVYDPMSGRFTTIGTMNRSRYKHEGTMVVLRDSTVLIASGASAPETFDPRTNSFHSIAASSQMPGSFSAVAMLGDGRVLITGGYGNGISLGSGSWIFTPR